MTERKRGGPSLRIERPDVKACPVCLPANPGVYQGALYECVCGACNGLGVVTEDGDPIPVEEANEVLARLVIAQRRMIYDLQAKRERDPIGSAFD